MNHRPRNWLQKMRDLWTQLTEPRYETETPEERHRARLVTSLILLLTPLGIPIAIIGTLSSDGTLLTPSFYMALVGISAGVIIYYISRTIYFKYGYVVVIGTISVIVFIIALVEPEDDGGLISLVYLAFPIIVSSTMMRARMIVWISAIQIGGVIVVNLARPESLPYPIMIDLVGFLLMTTAAVVLMTRDRNRLEQERNVQLHTSEREFRTIFEMSPIGMAINSPDRYYLRANRAFCEMIGYTETELKGKTFLDLTPPDDLDTTIAVHERTLQGEITTFRREKSYVRRDGSHLPCQLQVATIYDSDGGVDHYISQMVDISERKQAEAELRQAHDELEQRVKARTAELSATNEALEQQIAERERAEAALSQSEAYLRKIFDHSNEAILVISIEDDCIYDANPFATSMLGYSYEELMQCPISTIHPSEMEAVNKLAHTISRDGHGWTDELTCMLKSGQKIPVEISASSFEYDAKAAILCLVRDVSRRKAAEKALRDERNLLHTVIDNAADYIFVKDLESRYVLMNRATKERIGLPENKTILGNTAETLYPDMAAQFRDDDHYVIETGQSLLNREHSTINADGEEVWISTNKVPLHNNDDTIIGVVAVSRDITELKRVQQRLQQANDELEQRVTERTAELTTANQQLQHEIAERKQVQEALRTSEERLRSIFEHSNDAIFLIDPFIDRIIEANPMASTMLHYTPEALLQVPMSKVHPTDFSDLQAFTRSVLEEGHGWTDDLMCVTSDGQSLEVEISASALILDGQSLMLALVRDIGERKRTQLALQESKQLYESLVSTVDGIVWEADADTFEYTYVSPQAERLLGFPTSRWIDDSDFWADHIHPEDRDWAVEYCTHQSKTGHGHEFEYRMIDADGQIVWLHDIVTIVMENDKTAKLRGIMVDISERKRIEDERQRDNQRLAYMLGIHRAILGTQTVEEIARGALSQTRLLIPYHRGSVVVFDFEQGYGNVLAVNKDGAMLIEPGDRIPLDIWNLDQLEKGQFYQINNDDVAELIEPAQQLKAEGMKQFVMIPLIAQDKLIGVLNMGSQDDAPFEQETIELLREIADPLAVAIQQTNLRIQLEQHATELQTKTESLATINAVADAVYRSFDLPMIADMALQAVAAYTQANALGIFVPDEEAAVIRRLAVFGEVEQILDSGRTLPLHESAAGIAIRENRMIVIDDIGTDDRIYQKTPNPLLASGFKSGVVLPLPYHDRAIGEMTLLFKSSYQLTVEQEETLRSIGKTIGLALSNAQYVTDIRAESSEREAAQAREYEQRLLAEALRQTSEVLSSTLDINEVLDRILEQVARVIPHDQSSIMLIAPDGDVSNISRYRRYVADENTIDLQEVEFALEEFKTLQHMVTTREACVISDVRESDLWTPVEGADWMRSYVGAPIQIGDEIVGFIHIDSSVPNKFDGDHALILKAFANQASIALQNARLYEQIHDYATLLEERVDERTRQLQVERNRLDVILNATAEGIMYTEGAAIQYTNRAFAEITGYSQDEILHQSATILQPADATEEEAQNLEHIYEQIIGGKIWRGEARLRKRDGDTFISGQTVSLVAPGEPIRTVTVVRDISKVKELQEQKERFITHASHELRTPITNLKSRVFLMKNQPDRRDEHMYVIENVVNRMKTLVENLLDLSRFERGVIVLNHRKTNLYAVISNVVMAQETEAEHKQINLLLEPNTQTLYVNGDGEWLQHVFTNLIVNAINYTPVGGDIRVRVTTGYNELRQVQQAVIEIEDTGIGISKAHQAQIFESFFRVGTGEGTGLGLSITQEIVRLHGGEVTVESTPGVGSCFMVTLDLLTS